MNPVVAALLLAVAFVGTHVGLATGPIRSRLVRRLGEWGFQWLFTAVAAATFGLLVVFYADHRDAGGPGLDLGATPVVRWLLVGAVALGVVLMTASFRTYADGPYAVGGGGTPRPPRGVERVTRHPFFAGFALFGTAHALLAPHAIGAVLMLSLAVLAVVGARHQDAKLARLRGRPFADYLAATSAVPFAAIVAGRQRLAWRELPVGVLALGVGVAAGLRSVHDGIFAYHGAWVVGGTVGTAVTLALAAWLRERRAARGARPTSRAPGAAQTNR